MENSTNIRTGIENRSADSIQVKSNYKLVRIRTKDILFIKALSDYIIIMTTSSKVITLYTMKDILEVLPKNFARVHRSYIVNMNKVKSMKGSEITIVWEKKTYVVPIGRAYKKDLKGLV